MLLVSSSQGSYHHGSLARALEDAAMQLLERMPAPEISLREVARAANVSHNAPYHHFTDRKGLIQALAERSMADLVDAVHAAVAAGGSAQEDLFAGGVAYIRFAVDRPHAFNAVYDPTVCIPGAPTERMAPLIDDLAVTLGQAVAAAGLSEEEDARSLWATIHGLGTLSAAGHFSVDEAISAYASALNRLLGVHEDSPGV